MLEDFLNAKPLFYDEIDYTRMPRVYNSIKKYLKLPKIIHLVGTNGKGTTGRFLASALFSLGFKTGHYTSPHILHFNERVWLDGKSVTNTLLNAKHEELLTYLTKEDTDALSYFEYTTLLAMLIYRDVDYLVLEAGLGGEFDATAVFTNILTLVTPIDIDHEAFLGDTIKAIATTKLNATQTQAILAKQKHVDVYRVAEKLEKKKKISFISIEKYIEAGDRIKIEKIAIRNSLASYLQDNLTLAISALNYLEIPYTIESFDNSRLFGRLSQISENILLDVGHNVLAARSIVASLNDFKYTLVYNSYKDKNYKEILTILKPIINDVEIIAIDDERGESIEIMQETLNVLGIKNQQFVKISKEKNYLVFGSFSVAEAFLKGRSE